MKLRQFILTGLMVQGLFVSAWSQSKNEITVKANQFTAEVQPTMWGVFFEDINFGAEGDFLIVNRQKTNTTNPRFLCVTLHQNKKGSIGLNNEGFRGMGIKKDVG